MRAIIFCMKVIVLGAGLIGVATAYYLWRDGHEVEVFDRNDEAASETSYANACLVSASRALPWPTPNIGKTIWRALTDPSAPMRIVKPLDPRLWRWGGEFVSYANEAQYDYLSKAKLEFTRFCQSELESTIAETGLDCGYRRDGLLYICRSEASLESARARLKHCAKFGGEAKLLSRAEAIALEPALSQTDFVGASFAPTDAQGDSRRFTRALAAYLSERGVVFRYGAEIRATLSVIDRGYGVFANLEPLQADKFVVALGPASYHFAKQLSLKLPIYPVKGFSLTVPIKDPSKAPSRGGICEDSLVAFCPLGGFMRLTTGALFTGDDTTYHASNFEAHHDSFESLFPGALDWKNSAAIEPWACLRPMTPSSLPILTTQVNHFGDGSLIWNCGQGHIGWTMGCGSARVAADLVAERDPSFPLNAMQKC
ncbi:MAG: FAD-dependent oxidoreductase [Betaproteobacteria bacterium]|nr:MAG: FAD-dependent oxidoreductase [Betaproteobacteria bacterium]